jgi:regulator of ribonuclease activity A
VIPTSDICDRFGDRVRVVEPVFRSFGGRQAFTGVMETVRVSEDNALVRQVIESPGEGRVLVVDGGGSRRCALLGGRLAALAATNGWAGVVVNGCVRDTAEIAAAAVGVLALASNPRPPSKSGAGERSVPVSFAGVTFVPGHRLWADGDGIVVGGPDLQTG